MYQKTFIWLTIVHFSVHLTHGQTLISLEDIWVNYKYFPASPDEITPFMDGEHYVKINENTLEKFSFNDGKSKGLLTPKLDISIESFEFDEKGETILLTSESKPIYRHSTDLKAYGYSIGSKGKKKPFPIAEGSRIMLPDLNPNGNYCAYIQDNNLHIQNLLNGEIQKITQDGKKNEVLNGLPDWVYEEEFSLVKAYEWNQSGKKIAFLRFDERQVPSFSMPLYQGNLYPLNYTFKYPKVGEVNSKVTLMIYDMALKKTQGIVIPEPYEYLPRFAWLDEHRLLLAVMNRLQNRLVIYEANALTGSSRKVIEFFSPRYLEIEKMWTNIFPNAQEYLILSEEDGFFHIYSVNLQNGSKRKITNGEWEVTKIYGFDKNSGFIYYQSCEVSPLERHIYRIKLDGSGKQKLTLEAGTHDAEFSPSFKYMIKNFSALNQPPEYTCHVAEGKLLYYLEKNEKLNDLIKNLEGSGPEFFTCTTSTGTHLNGWMMKPSSFDPDKKYPVFMYVYGGPGAQTVTHSFGGFNYMWFRMLAQKGFVVVSVDGRGTGGRGYEFRTCTYGKLGDLESTDQVEAAKWLAQQPFVDAKRIGIFGWSYGGYLSSLCITRWADYFKLAIAVAPVTNWRYYDNIYTERYMGTLETNPNGFDEQSPIRFAKYLKGKFLLIHGTADDNVHWQNTISLVSELQKNNKQFQTAFYPGGTHGIAGGLIRLQLYTMITNYITEKL